LSGLGIDEADRTASAHNIVRFLSQFTPDSVEDLRLQKRLIVDQPLVQAFLFAHLKNTPPCGAISPHEMLSNVSVNVIVEDEMIFILLEEHFVRQLEAISYLCLAVGTDQIEIEGLTVLILDSFFQIRVIFKNTIDCHFTLYSERGPFATHQTDQATVGVYLDDVGTADRRC